jgi:hypothetical protein
VFTLGAITPTTVQLSGSVSGTTLLQSPPVAGSAVITFPSVTGTLAIIGNTVSQFAAGGTLSSLTGFSLRSTGAAFDLSLATSEVLTANRTLSFNVGNADRTLTIPATGTAALLGTANVFTAAQTINAGSLATAALTLSQTWNNAGVTCRGLEYAVTDTNSAASSTLLRLLGGVAGTAVKFGVKKEGTWFQNYYGTNLQFYDDDGTTLRSYSAQGRWFGKDFNDTANTTSLGRDGATGIALAKSAPLVFSSGAQWFSTEACRLLSATGSPEGAVTAGVGSLFLRQDGGANTTLYIKESGTGNTGWIAK